MWELVDRGPERGRRVEECDPLFIIRKDEKKRKEKEEVDVLSVDDAGTIMRWG